MQIVNLKEYEKSKESLSLGEDFNSFKNSRFLNLIVGDKEGEYKIEATQYVGSLTIGKITVNVEPKIGSVNFLKMLLEGDDEAKENFTEALNKKNNDLNIFDLLANTLSREILSISRKSIKRDYVEKEENLSFLRGSLLIEKDLVNNLSDRTRIYCRYTEYSENIELNKALKWAVETLRVNLNFGDNILVNQASRTLSSIDMPYFCPNLEALNIPIEYKKAIKIVTWIRDFIIVGHGESKFLGSGLFIDMNKVFEGFVRERLRKVAINYGYFVPTKKNGSRNLCRGVGLEPDILVCNGQGIPVVVADTKYKVDWSNINSDVYQMLAYLEGYRSSKNAFIIFPSNSESVDLRDLELPRNRFLKKVPIKNSEYFDTAFWHKVFLGLINETKIELSEVI